MDKIKEFIEKYINTNTNISDIEFKQAKQDLKSLINSQWISVEDELPKDNNNDEDREFIVEIAIKHSCVYPVTSAQWDRKEQRFYKGIEYLEVVHWQPLPKPPKE